MNADEHRFAYYKAFGLEPTLSIDPEELKKRFYEQSRKWHPDRFSRGSAEEQQKALDMTSTLNDAFRTLRDPYSRGEYFLKESGIELSKQVPAYTLEEFFDANMCLDELRNGDQSVRPQLLEVRDKYHKNQADFEKLLLGFFELYDRYDESKRAGVIVQIKDTLNIRRYIANFLREAEKEMNVLPN